MRGVMQRVSAHLPALMRTCLFDWKAVRSRYTMGATSEDDQCAAGGRSVCLLVCVLGVRVSCHIEPYRRHQTIGGCAMRAKWS